MNHSGVPATCCLAIHHPSLEETILTYTDLLALLSLATITGLFKACQEECPTVYFMTNSRLDQTCDTNMCHK